ncbi:PX domain-containing protein kinase-like protein [Xenia sp. Carnegie-2017]|uniref:PX domain-containing protein kinase-like protein n=1 Tax=Xenia sp. Carnegie-2017 TaxID=2897299 RepID=UPI001F04FE11|nr:PX domain-containing protein kinase-like protein [Xenia sp. Carnegie-2017]XP_046840764.1 PX domain-containing protein kinase-like protein [Xenia sp. Carnegie-2017]
MSLLEKRESSAKLDDTIPLYCYIEGHEKKETFVEYRIRVQRGPNPENQWMVLHRYNDFDVMNKVLETSGATLPLPPKKMFGNMDNAFIAERLTGLQQYLQRVMEEPMFVRHECFKQFMDPKNYPLKMQDEAAEQVAMFYRSEPSWELVETLPDIGWRIRKHYFLTKYTAATQKNDRQILAWVEYGPDMILSKEKDLPAAMKLLTNIMHPYIYPVRIATVHEKGAAIVRDFRQSGTLKDFICKARPKTSHLKKYCYPKMTVSMQLEDIRRCGRQILEALKILQDKGFPYGQLHTGNIIMDGNVVRLLDIENSILGVPSIYRHYLLELKQIKDLHQQDVYSFGHVLYEMTFGKELRAGATDEIPANCPPLIEPILSSILTSEALKQGNLPTIKELLQLPFFAEVQLGPEEKMSLKIPSKLKEALKQVKEEIEKRLKEDRKVLSQFRRYSKAQAKATSKEEKDKRRQQRKQMKKQESLAENSTSDRTKTSIRKAQSVDSSRTSNFPSVPPPPPLVPSPPPAASTNGPTGAPTKNKGRGALLSSITSFRKNNLKTTKTNDRSAPKV